jgi:hypothetical protein
LNVKYLKTHNRNWKGDKEDKGEGGQGSGGALELWSRGEGERGRGGE